MEARYYGVHYVPDERKDNKVVGKRIESFEDVRAYAHSDAWEPGDPVIFVFQSAWKTWGGNVMAKAMMAAVHYCCLSDDWSIVEVGV